MAKNLINASIVQEDIEQIDEDDLEDMDIKWQAAMLAVRSKRLYNRTGRSSFNGPADRIGFDKSKAICNNYHQPGHFARECNMPKQMVSQGNQSQFDHNQSQNYQSRNQAVNQNTYEQQNRN